MKISPIRVIRGSLLRLSVLCLLSSVLCCLPACSHHKALLTIAPHSVVTTQASFDENQQNSGLISANDKGFLVTQHFIERHQINTTDHGVTVEGHYYRITAQVMAKCIDLDQARKKQQQ
jgi:hypothetical protein